MSGLKMEENHQNKLTEDPKEEYINLPGCKIIFLPLTAMQDFVEKSKYENLFDLAYFSNSGVANLINTPELADKIFRQKKSTIVVCETAKHLIEMKAEQINGFSERIAQIAKSNQWTDLSEKIVNAKVIQK